MLQGTGSDVGKSILVAGLCRALSKRGLRVRPFKPQNMSNNAAVTDTGGEIGRAQALQALACGVDPTIHMNPVLLKPQSDVGAQIIVHGKMAGTGTSSYYRENKKELLDKVIESFNHLRNEADIVIVEGAGSPAEVNLRDHDIANMGFALESNTPVVLIGDIDRGGVIASIVGTNNLLSDEDNDLIKGYIINKFRGDPSLFDSAHDVMTSKTGWQNIGMLPFIPAVKMLPAEDAVVLDHETRNHDKKIKISVPMLSRIANFDDLDPLIAEPDVDVCFVRPGEPLPFDTDLVIIPGSKSTIADLDFFNAQGWNIDLAYHIRNGGKVLGICGGYQMLGKSIFDPVGIEGTKKDADGLGYLDVNTVLETEKTVRNTSAYCKKYHCETNGYEIHTGETIGPDTCRSLLTRNDFPLGASSENGKIEGVYLHGLFNDDQFRMKYLSQFRNGAEIKSDFLKQVNDALDVLANEMEEHLDISKILEIAGQH